MNSIQEFKEWLVIEQQESYNNQFGHFPFQLFYEDVTGKTTIGALFLGESDKCYKVFHEVMKAGAPRAYMSVDFPAMEGHIDTDFIAVFSFDGGHMELEAIPYNTETGERLPEISYKDNRGLQMIMQHFCRVNLEESGILEKGK